MHAFLLPLGVPVTALHMVRVTSADVVFGRSEVLGLSLAALQGKDLLKKLTATALKDANARVLAGGDVYSELDDVEAVRNVTSPRDCTTFVQSPNPYDPLAVCNLWESRLYNRWYGRRVMKAKNGWKLNSNYFDTISTEVAFGSVLTIGLRQFAFFHSKHQAFEETRQLVNSNVKPRVYTLQGTTLVAADPPELKRKAEEPPPAVAASSAAAAAAPECPICLDSYYKPVSLACGHTLCHACFLGLKPDELDPWRKCPTCRAAQKVKKLTPNYAIESLVEAHVASLAPVPRMAFRKEQEKRQAALDELLKAERKPRAPRKPKKEPAAPEPPRQPVIDLMDDDDVPIVRGGAAGIPVVGDASRAIVDRLMGRAAAGEAIVIDDAVDANHRHAVALAAAARIDSDAAFVQIPL